VVLVIDTDTNATRRGVAAAAMTRFGWVFDRSAKGAEEDDCNALRRKRKSEWEMVKLDES
jgi:hypothetical protein